MNRKIIISLGATALLLGACSEVRDVKLVGSWDDPYCAPDGSVVWGVFPNDAGSYDPIKSNRANCPWHAGKPVDKHTDVKVASNN